MKLFFPALCVVQSFLMVVSSFSEYDSNFRYAVDRAAYSLISETDFSFDTLSADKLQITDKEKNDCRKWYNENVICTSGKPAYNFTVGGKNFRNNIDDYDISVGKESDVGEYHRGGKTTFVTLKHKKSSLVVTVEATIYEEYASCEWTVFIKNTGDEKSPVIKDFYGADCNINLGKSELYVSRGSRPRNDDFELLKMPVSKLGLIFNANGGRSASFLPYFNLNGENGSAVVSVGWTGQWHTKITQKNKGINIKAKQEYFKAYLTSGEQVRSPLVSVTFYDGDNAVKGFNSYRKWVSNCVYAENFFPLTTTGLAGEFDRRGIDEYIEQVKSYDDYTCSITDFLWRDAGWYKINGDWYDSVGNWVADPERFPNGLAPVADEAAKRGMGLLLWYEPERCCKDTIVYNECKKHEGWLIECSDNVNMVNLAMDGACEYLGNLVAQSIKDNHVGLYRQDFNFTPLSLWRDADKNLWNNRKGIEENHYVTNLYKYLDTLIEVNPGLIIDNCASGGKRLDLEMSRRSIPLWRTDYNCADPEGKVHDDCPEATQVSSYGISCWLPLTGTGINLFGEYNERSFIVPCSQRAQYGDIRKFMQENYFPLTYGGLNYDEYLAMQFGTDRSGTALIYKRSEVEGNAYLLKLSGLRKDVSYKVYDYDNQGTEFFATGEELMNKGITLTIGETPKAAIYMYNINN